MTAGLTYTGETVRKHDPDRFLLSMYMPPERRAALWALYAFNYEIAKTREVVTETQLGLIRLQWWRDAIAAIYEGGAVPQHQVVAPLAEAIAAYKLPREPFDNLVFAREFDLEDRLPANLAGTIHYADFTSTPLLHLGSLVSGQDGAEKDCAIAYALTGILRATPYHLAQRRCYLPQDLLPEAGELYEGKNLQDLQPAVQAVADAATQHLSRVSTRSKLARLHATLANMHLRQIRAADCNLFSPMLTAPPFLRELRLAWASLKYG